LQEPANSIEGPLTNTVGSNIATTTTLPPSTISKVIRDEDNAGNLFHIITTGVAKNFDWGAQNGKNF